MILFIEPHVRDISALVDSFEVFGTPIDLRRLNLFDAVEYVVHQQPWVGVAVAISREPGDEFIDIEVEDRWAPKGIVRIRFGDDDLRRVRRHRRSRPLMSFSAILLHGSIGYRNAALVAHTYRHMALRDAGIETHGWSSADVLGEWMRRRR